MRLSLELQLYPLAIKLKSTACGYAKQCLATVNTILDYTAGEYLGGGGGRLRKN